MRKLFIVILILLALLMIFFLIYFLGGKDFFHKKNNFQEEEISTEEFLKLQENVVDEIYNNQGRPGPADLIMGPPYEKK